MVTRICTASRKMNCASLLRTSMILPIERNVLCISKSVPLKCLGNRKTNLTSNTIKMVRSIEPTDSSSTRVPSSSSSYSICGDMVMEYNHKRGKNGRPLKVSNFNMLYSKTIYSGKSTRESDPASQGRPSEQQLDTVMKVLSDSLPKLFSMKTPPASIFHRNVILDNHIRGTRTVGLGKYMSQVALLQVIGHIKLAYVKFHILKITKHSEEGTIKCRWRIEGIGRLAIIHQYWNRDLKSFDENVPTWYDGFSTYYVGSDGLIYRHVVDKMMPDDDKIVTDGSTLASQMAMYLGSLPRREQRIFFEVIPQYTNNLTYLSKAKLPREKLQRL